MTLENVVAIARERPEQAARIIEMWLEEDEQVYTGCEKAAAFMISAGPKTAMEIFNHLREDEKEKIAAEITKLKSVGSKQQINILGEFLKKLEKSLPGNKGGSDYVRKILGPGKP